ncbi:MAG TPA: hypothetical protein V6D43_00625 [Candidatus Sericytochromatia bacterium]
MLVAKGDCVLARNRWWATVRGLFSFLMAAVLAWGLVACGDRIDTPQALNTEETSKTLQRGSLSEVAPPPVIQQLSQSLDAYQPQVTIVSPNTDEVLQDTTVSVKFQVQDLPIFKDPDLGLGLHLHAILDNQPYKAVYDLDQPLVFEDLAPGTHTLRVFASRPWHESFKNEGAYAQTTFHIFTKTTDNNPDPALPLLTYSRPTGSYGAEPIMLDFYLTNAPLHLVAQESPDDDIADWRIRVTVNGESFVLDRWQPIYLKGFKRGKNWVQLEFLDEKGNPVKNVFNNTVRLIDYEPKGKDTLSKLVRGEISAEAARGLVEPDYKLKPTPTPSVTATPSPSPIPSPTEIQTSIPPVTPSVEETPTEPATPEEKPTPSVESTPTETRQTAQPKSGGFFGRFRRPDEVPTPSPSPESVVPEESEVTPQPEAPAIPSESPAPVEDSTPTPESTPTEPLETQKPKSGGFFSGFRRPTGSPTLSPKQPEVLEAPSPEPSGVPELPEPQPELTSEPKEATVRPTQPVKSLEEATPSTKPVIPDATPAPVIKPVPIPIKPEKSKAEGSLKGLQPSAVDKVPTDSGLPPTLPEIIETPFPKPLEPEAAFPQPNAAIAPEPQSSPTTLPESTPEFR